MMYKSCIFDLDGTLTDTLDSLTFSVNLTMKEMGLPEITREQCRMFVGNGSRVLLEKALRAASEEAFERLEEAMEIYGRVFNENCMYHVAPYEGIVQLLGTLKEQESDALFFPINRTDRRFMLWKLYLEKISFLKCRDRKKACRESRIRQQSFRLQGRWERLLKRPSISETPR